jgi:hypothetical protein
MSDLTQIDTYCREARNFVFRAGEIVQALRRDGACEGHNLVAAQNVVALKRLSQILERQQQRLASDALPKAVDPPISTKRHWWSALRWAPRGHATSSRHVPDRRRTVLPVKILPCRPADMIM